MYKKTKRIDLIILVECLLIVIPSLLKLPFFIAVIGWISFVITQIKYFLKTETIRVRKKDVKGLEAYILLIICSIIMILSFILAIVELRRGNIYIKDFTFIVRVQ